MQIPLRRDAILRARDRARSTRRPHNVARKLFVTELLNELARAEARVLTARRRRGPAGRPRAMWAEPGVCEAIDALWPVLTPQRLLADLLRSSHAIRSAAGTDSPRIERPCLHVAPPVALDGGGRPAA